MTKPGYEPRALKWEADALSTSPSEPIDFFRIIKNEKNRKTNKKEICQISYIILDKDIFSSLDSNTKKANTKLNWAKKKLLEN